MSFLNHKLLVLIKCIFLSLFYSVFFSDIFDKKVFLICSKILLDVFVPISGCLVI